MLLDMYKGVANSPETTITNDINNTDTIIYVLDETRIPEDLPNLMVLGTGVSAETIKVLSIEGNVITVERGFQGIPRSWNAGTIIARNFTEYDYNALIENVKTLKGNTDTNAGDILSLMNYVGNLENLDTVEKSNIVLALNEIYQDLRSHKAEKVSSSNGVHGLKYEIGDFTPSLKFGGNNAEITYGAQAGTYTRIGRFVYFEIILLLTNKGISTGNATIDGLPFVSFNRPRFFLFSPDRMNLPTAGQDFKAWIGANKSNIELYSRRTGSSDIAVTNEQFLNTTNLYIAGYYQTI